MIVSRGWAAAVKPGTIRIFAVGVYVPFVVRPLARQARLVAACRRQNVKDCAMRWILLVVSIAAFSLAYAAKTSGTLGFALLVGVIALVGAFLGFAQSRIAATARPDAAMLSDKDIATLQNAVRNAKKNPPAPPPRA